MKLLQLYRPKLLENTKFYPGSVLPYEDFSNEDYHSSPGLSKSGVVKVIESVQSLTAEDNVDSKALRIGTAVNDAILYPEYFLETYKLGPGDRRTTAYKKWESELKEGQVPLTPDESEIILRCRDAANENPVLSAILQSDVVEREPSMFANSPEGNVVVKCRPDIIAKAKTKDTVTVIDIKTAHNASMASFRSACYRYRYDISSFLTKWIIEEIVGVTPRYIFAVIDKRFAGPGAVAFYEVDPGFEKRGEMDCRLALRRLDSHLTALENSQQVWEGYPVDIQTIGLEPERLPIEGD